MTLELRFGGYQGERSVHTRAVRVMAEALERLSGGAARLVVTENVSAPGHEGAGHKAADLLRLTEEGAFDGCYFWASYLTGRVPDLGLFDQHFRVPERERAHAMLDGALGAGLREAVAERTGYRVLGYWDNGFRHLASARPISRPEDCRGLRIRAFESEEHRRVFRALGFEPVDVDVRDIPAAVEAGRVDAQENSLTNTLNLGVHRSLRHVVLTRHLLGVTAVLFNARSLDDWDPALRAALQGAVDEATLAQRRFAAEEDAHCLERLEAEGAEITELAPAARAAFAAATQPAVEETRRRFDPRLLALFDAKVAAG